MALTILITLTLYERAKTCRREAATNLQQKDSSE
ncbi:hypothetical protein COLO4_36350 [Corchorus olitorius]|uniref:Uncharacterized protein n=1 Tax=Corchorus olitorius TaxID=93759 RepID=A0A1R3G9M2_9ROSI|nr:hypothetical protein COLO4_36350 [Corchorus olitorius]